MKAKTKHFLIGGAALAALLLLLTNKKKAPMTVREIVIDGIKRGVGFYWNGKHTSPDDFYALQQRFNRTFDQQVAAFDRPDYVIMPA